LATRRGPAKEPRSVVCWRCLAPINPRARFKVDYLFAPAESFRRPLSVFGFCTQCQPQGGLSFFIGSRVKTITEGDLYTGYSAMDPGKKITVLWTRAQSSSRQVLNRLRRNLFSVQSKCPCGAAATDLHHVIPRYWFRLNRIPEDASHFAENLLPVCSACNQRWYNFSVFARDSPKYWAEHPRARGFFEAKLSEALEAARSAGFTVYPPPQLDFYRLPAQPVLTKPDRPTDSALKVAAFVDVFWWIRTHSAGSGPSGPAWRGANLKGQGNPYMVLVSWEHLVVVP
jgi:hypothetical protein